MKAMWLLGGLGLGVGLTYLLDPEKGERRRGLIGAQLTEYGRQTDDLLDATRRTLGRQAHSLLDKTRWSPRPQPGLGDRLLVQAEQVGLTKGLLLLGCIGLGAGMMYMLEPSGGPRRRALVRDTVRAYWHNADDFLRTSASEVRRRTGGQLTEKAQSTQPA
jgi:hypothetical protein